MFLLLLIPTLIFIFYLRYINLSIDVLNLFLPQKIFIGHWISRGIFPFFNPNIFMGTPFAFDLGLGNFHPFNLFFLLPYPISFALFAGATTLFFLVGFYLFFLQLAKSRKISLLLTLILFFSGGGLFIRMNNPTIWAVISHYGLFFYFLKKLKEKNLTAMIYPLFVGALMTLSGHIQFVIYGYILATVIAIFFYKISLKKIILFFLLLFAATSWYFIFSVPQIIESTRLISHSVFSSAEKIAALQFIQLILPFIFGQVHDGARWSFGYSSNILSSLLFLPVLVYIVNHGKYSKWLLLLVIIFILNSLGYIQIPFFRISNQIFIIVQIIGLSIIAINEDKIYTFFKGLKKYLLQLFGVCLISLISGIISNTDFFTRLFLTGYKIVKHRGQNLFFDTKTIAAIGNLFSLNLFLLSIFILFLIFAIYYRKRAIEILIIYVIIEGIIINFFFNFFIKSVYLKTKFIIPKKIDSVNYRVQTTADLIPYFGLSNYIDNVYFRPPFSKEKSLFDASEQKTFSKLKEIMSYIPSDWANVAEIKTVQGYDSFVPQILAEYFSTPSADFKEQYGQIIKKNKEFGKNTNVSNINAIDTSFITINDERWKDLSVRYFIIQGPRGRSFAQMANALPIYYISEGKIIKIKKPFKENPNEFNFKINAADRNKTLIVNMNPGGFAAELNGKKITIKKEQLKMFIFLSEVGILKIYYSPIVHLQETL